MGRLTLSGVSKSYGDTQVLRGIDLELAAGEFTVFVGPSGCGKSTLLRMIAGLESVTSGEILADGVRFNDVPAARRGVAMVFQNYALYPHMTVFGNLSYGLKIAGTPRAEVDRIVRNAADLLQITPLLDRRPGQLSGGQRQRVAIGRAMVRQPSFFLFDEPLSNLDAGLRVAMRAEIARLHKMLGTTMIYVTHDQVEAMTLADRIVVLDSGAIMQVGTPRELYETPANIFVAQFIGSPRINLLPCEDDGQSVRLVGGAAVDPGRPLGGRAAFVGVRAEDLTIVDPQRALIPAKVDSWEYLGSDVSVTLEAGLSGLVTARVSGGHRFAEGELVGLDFAPSAAHFFGPTGERV